MRNRPVSVTDGQNTTTFVYDGDGNRVMKTEGGETILYVNRYYEKNLDTGEITTYYYLGGRLIAQRKGSDLSYVHQDHLTGTSLMTDSSGDSEGAIKFYPYGSARSGSVPTDKLFTGQRLDDTGLYYYNARYYDPTIGRFISPDPMVRNATNPQNLNRYSYALNNPLRYTDQLGLFEEEELESIGITKDDVSNATWLMLLDAEVGDRIDIVIGGVESTYYFYHEAQYELDETGVLKALSESGQFSNVTDIVSDSGLESMERYVWDKHNIAKDENWLLADIIDDSGLHSTICGASPHFTVPTAQEAIGIGEMVVGGVLVGVGGLEVCGAILTGPFAPIVAVPGIILIYGGTGAIFSGAEKVWDVDLPDFPLIP